MRAVPRHSAFHRSIMMEQVMEQKNPQTTRSLEQLFHCSIMRVGGHIQVKKCEWGTL